MIVVFTQISIFGLLTIAIERFYAISQPFSYTNHCTGKLSLIVIAVSWMAAIIVGMVPLFGWNLGDKGLEKCSFTEVISYQYMVYFNFFACVLAPLLAMFVIYCYIFRVVRKQLRQIDSLQVSNESGGKSKVSKLKKDINAAKWFAVVILLFAGCWLPIHIMNTVTLLAGIYYIKDLLSYQGYHTTN